MSFLGNDASAVLGRPPRYGRRHDWPIQRGDAAIGRPDAPSLCGRGQGVSRGEVGKGRSHATNFMAACLYLPKKFN